MFFYAVSGRKLNNLSASIYADTYRSQRETNFSEYLNTLYSSGDYTAMLEDMVTDGLASKIPLSTDDYQVRDQRVPHYCPFCFLYRHPCHLLAGRKGYTLRAGSRPQSIFRYITVNPDFGFYLNINICTVKKLLR